MKIIDENPGDGFAESWAAYPYEQHTALKWHAHERTLNSLIRRGFVTLKGDVTEAGRAALAAVDKAGK